MGGDGGVDDQLVGAPVRVSAAYEGSTLDIARARELARSFLASFQTSRGLAADSVVAPPTWQALLAP